MYQCKCCGRNTLDLSQPLYCYMLLSVCGLPGPGLSSVAIDIRTGAMLRASQYSTQREVGYCIMPL